MVEHVVIGVDESAKSRAAVQFVVDEFDDLKLTLVHVLNPGEAASGGSVGGFPSGAEDWYEDANERGHRYLSEAAETIPDGFEVDSRVELGSPAERIVAVAEEEGADHIVVGSHGRSGVSRLLLGSVAERVVRTSPVPVTVIR
ncbi:Nucleotide-binding protein, UspA family [Halalkaliarchaeum sp. AArc-CO]|uniref:universal stress protein n=1 Tax=unclassified Halalkaliarchaeum TaxID=2678344 RepID=UPI00217DDEDA|nr:MULTISPECIES: universal stress protein [unclassified Halalkaliarchaeum]MDR5673947.1 universal stress protein [Halalkaliarchaeum sp. AArc-GB]UWG50583.1 Nucleotide-binding protein, UspA family [Halalkaliarchaeum sp. AArc-CO]